MKKVLITSGGTKVKIDDVRHIGNMSSGTFGSRLAGCFAMSRTNVTFLKAKGSKSAYDNLPSLKYAYYEYQEINYDDFYDYEEKLEVLCKQGFDYIVLAAAVSDYLVVDPVKGKIRSSDELVIKLKPAPKLISKVREWCPECKLVGFKLLVDSTEDQLIEAARSSIDKNDCDIVIANDLRDIKNNNHTVRIVRKETDDVKTYYSKDNEFNHLYLADCVVKEVLK